MWTPFLFEIAHFAICLFTALVLFATFWLYFDAWKEQKTVGGLARCVGFLVLSISFIITSVILESTVIQVSLIQLSKVVTLQLIFRNLGYALIFTGIVSEKLQHRPTNSLPQVAFGVPFLTAPLISFQIVPLLLSVLVAIFYTIRAVIGLEAHIKPAARAFAMFSLFELLALSAVFRGSSNITLHAWLAPFGIIWIAQYVVLFFAAVILGRWVFGYLLKQFLPQLFMILSSLVLIIFLVTTTVFTSLLLRNVQKEVLSQLENDIRMLQYAMDSKRTEAIADAQIIAQNTSIQTHLQEKNIQELGVLAEQFLLSKKYSTLLIMDNKGQIMARGEDTENVGGFVTDDALIKRAVGGQAASSFTTTDGVLAPLIALSAVAPIMQDQQVVGVVQIGTVIDNTFVDGIKQATGLEASLYGQYTLSATTLVGADNTTRLTGVIEQNQTIIEQVLVAGKIYSGGTMIGNTVYFIAQAPLFDVDNVAVGMMSVGREQIGVFQAASRSLELTFMASAMLLVISILPSFLISRYIAHQL